MKCCRGLSLPSFALFVIVLLSLLRLSSVLLASVPFTHSAVPLSSHAPFIPSFSLLFSFIRSSWHPFAMCFEAYSSCSSSEVGEVSPEIVCFICCRWTREMRSFLSLGLVEPGLLPVCAGTSRRNLGRVLPRTAAAAHEEAEILERQHTTTTAAAANDEAEILQQQHTTMTMAIANEETEILE